MVDIYIKARTYELFPNKNMRKVLDCNCDYHRYCWNQALALWNDLYLAHTILGKTNKYPSWQLVGKYLIADKEDWQYNYTAHILQLAVRDLGIAWKNFLNKAQPDWGQPKFKSKRSPKQGFKSDGARLVAGKLVLDKPHAIKHSWQAIRLSEKPLNYPTGVMSFYRERGHYFVAIPYKIPKANFNVKNKTGKITGVDINVGHFNYQGGTKNVLPKKLKKIYKEINHYQRVLAKKRVVNGSQRAVNSKKYLKTRAKLQVAYKRATNFQTDLLQKFTTDLVNNYDSIVIEDLDVKAMLMSHVASKGMQRSMFGKFRQILTYKCEWYNKKLIIANKHYPSTQRCATCGNIKKGDDRITLLGNEKHHTRHNQYVCYNPSCSNYKQIVDRDQNAMLNLTLLATHPELNKAL